MPDPPVGYPPDTVMTQKQLALALSCSVDTITRSGIRATYALGLPIAKVYLEARHRVPRAWNRKHRGPGL
jgi:hypothetical protein